MQKDLKLYSNTGCSKCAMLKRWMDMKEIQYEELNISENEDARQRLLLNGLRALPQLEVEGEFITYEEYNDILEYI